MINRTLVRTKVMQTAFAYYKDNEKTPLTAKKELLKSFSNTYSLYALLLDLVNEITRLAEEKIENEMERARVLHEPYEANRRFVNNQFAQQIFNNRSLRSYMTDTKLSWDVAHESLAILWKQIQANPSYREYMAETEPASYDEDRMVWRKIFTDVLVDNEQLDAALEEMEIAMDGCGWVTDTNVVISYIIKTLKLFQPDSTADQSLLEMFDSEEELQFAKDLLDQTLRHKDENEQLIRENLKGWELERVAYMDRIILLVALAEITCFPDIALQVSMNEYIELAKEYGSDKSHQFINGILEEITRKLTAENKLIKAITL